MPLVCWNRWAAGCAGSSRIGSRRSDGRREIGPVPRRELGGLVQVLRAERQVRAVHREAREQLGDRVGDLGQALLDGGGVGELPVESAHLRPQDAVGDRALRAVDHLGPVGRRPAAQPGVELGERRLARGIDEHAVDVGERVVPGGARGRPARRHPLVALEDLLDEHVRPAGRLGEPVEVGARMPQPVGMVDAQPVGEAVADPARRSRRGSRRTPTAPRRGCRRASSRRRSGGS